MAEADDLDRWGQFLMESFRDPGVDFSQRLLRGDWKAPGLRMLQRALSSLGPKEKELVTRAVNASIDHALHSFLVGLRESMEDGEVVLTVGSTELSQLDDDLEGYLYLEDGWCARFSKFGEPPEEG